MSLSQKKTVVDPTVDTNCVKLAALARVYNFPGIVKSAELDSTMKPDSESPNYFAQPFNHSFPIHSGPATLLSTMYFYDQRGQLPSKEAGYIEDRLKQAADFFRVRADYDDLVKQAQTRDKHVELPNSHFAYVWEAEDGRVERYYPMGSAAEVKTAAEWLYKERNAIPLDVRHSISQKILIKAANTGAGLTPQLDVFLEKQAGRGIPDNAAIVAALHERARLVPEPLREGVEKLAATVKNNAGQFIDSADLIKLACVIEQLDHASGLRGKYTERIKSPEDVVFAQTFCQLAEKTASCCQLQTGNIYRKEQFKKIAASALSDVFGDDFLLDVLTENNQVDVEKLAEVAATLPRSDASVFESMLAEVAEYPDSLAKAASVVIPDDVLEEMAMRYTRQSLNKN